VSALGDDFHDEPPAHVPADRDAMDWDGVRVFLAVAREGSMRAAGRALGLSQPTIARRLAAMEAGFGGQPLFDRLPDGVRLTAAGEQLVEAAEDAERAMLTLERRRAATSPLSGTVRIATGECAGGFLARYLRGSTRSALPAGIIVELVDELRQRANLVRRQADMALRHEPPESGDFYVAKLGTFAVAVYRSRGMEAAAWVTNTEEQAHWPTARWVQRQIDETGMPVACRLSSMLMRVEAIRAGTGRGELPCYVGDGHPLLERVTPPIPELAAEYWMIVHRDLRHAPCVRATIDWMKALFAERREVLAGNSIPALQRPDKDRRKDRGLE
jgi:DNA-binding transcriptional LysR family regulator